MTLAASICPVSISRPASISRTVRFAIPALLLAGCGLSGPAHGPTSPNIVDVTMGFGSFDPTVVHIKAGESVEFRNTALITHSVTDDPKLAMDAKDASEPAGAAPFNSGDIAPGQVYTQTFTQPGTYTYFCTHHEDDGMVARIIVDPAS
jgi:plastocyanin